MAVPGAGRAPRRVVLPRRRPRPREHALELGERHRTRPEHERHGPARVHHRRLESDLGGRALQDGPDAPVEVVADGLPGRRAGAAAAVGRRRHQGRADGPEHRSGLLAGGQPDRDGVQPRRDGGRQPRSCPEHERQGPRRERLQQRLGAARDLRQRGGAGRLQHVDDERVVGGPPLGGEHGGDGAGVVGQRAEPVDGLRRERARRAAPEHGGGPVRVGREQGRHRA